MKINFLKKGTYSKEHIQTILKSWVIEDDAGDYFEYWMEKMELTKDTTQHLNNTEIIEKIELNMNNFLDLNYNILSELQDLKELLYTLIFIFKYKSDTILGMNLCQKYM